MLEKIMLDKIIKLMEVRKCRIFREKGEMNIVYIEGMNTNFTKNSDEPNHFNDIRMVIEFSENKPFLLGCWEATTEPGYFYTDNPMNEKGAARIAFGQYKAWQIGIHGYAEPHEALIQVDNVRVHRDYNRDMIRTGDYIDEGLFGINQHFGYDNPFINISTASAGCLVGRSRSGHYEFMKIIKRDQRYVDNPNYVFWTTILPGNEV
ncbi:MAG: Phormidium phage MIS-PhV1B [Cyanobacteriota bacterium]|jgi:hypothetical protein